MIELAGYNPFTLLVKIGIVLPFFILITCAVLAQQRTLTKADSASVNHLQHLSVEDSIKRSADSSVHSFSKYLNRKKNAVAKIFHCKKPSSNPKDSTLKSDTSKKTSVSDIARKKVSAYTSLLPAHKKDSSLSSSLSDSAIKNNSKNTIKKTFSSFSSMVPSFKKDSTKGILNNLLSGKDSMDKNKYPPSKTFVFKKAPFLRFQCGYISYGFNYRSSADTPFIEKDIVQHQINSSFHITVAGKVPLIVNSFIRRTNSPFFSPITDVQVLFDVPAYRNQLSSNLRSKLLQEPDSLTKNLLNISKLKLQGLQNWLFGASTREKIIDAHETINVPMKGYDPSLSDSVNKKHGDSTRNVARLFLALYERTLGEYESTKHQKDSLEKECKNEELKYKQLQKMLNGTMPDYGSYDSWSKKLQANTSKEVGITRAQKLLLGVKKFSVGRNNVNYSELTVKNLSLTGINAEYNSKYYFALAAGSVDYRFTEFIASAVHIPKQYLYVGRIGIGRLEKNYFIITGYHGEKQLFFGTVTGSQLSSIQITGLSAAAKWQMNRNSYIIGEVAQSFSPDAISTPVKSSWSISDKSNKALSLKVYTYFPKTTTKIEAQYKFMGANFQAFNSFQTNAQLINWSIKADQSLLKKKLHLLVSFRTQDYSNPYIIQDYKANTLLKSVSLTYREKGLPTFTAGYTPMSQLTIVGTQIVQNQFQTLNASVSHYYKIGLQQVATNLVYTRFFNSSLDTGFIYYNSTNIYLTHTLFFKKVTAGISISHSINPTYRYDVMDENFTFQVSKAGTVGGGVKINDLNKQELALGEYINMHLRIGKKDLLNVQADNGFLPGNGERLVKNFMGTISYTKTF